VVGPREPAARGEAAALLVGLLARGRVHDRSPARTSRTVESLGERAVHEPLARLAPADLRRPQRQVGPREAAHDLRRVPPPPQPRQDLVAHDRRGGPRGRPPPPPPQHPPPPPHPPPIPPPTHPPP